jgi:hypothetical protein
MSQKRALYISRLSNENPLAGIRDSIHSRRDGRVHLHAVGGKRPRNKLIKGHRSSGGSLSLWERVLLRQIGHESQAFDQTLAEAQFSGIALVAGQPGIDELPVE